MAIPIFPTDSVTRPKEVKMSAPIGSAFAPLSQFERTSDSLKERIIPIDVDKLTETSEPLEETITVYRIKNTWTGEFWSNGRWCAKGKVYLRRCDVTNTLNYMSDLSRTHAVVVEYKLVPMDSPLVERKELVNEIINFYTNTIKNFYEVLKKIG